MLFGGFGLSKRLIKGYKPHLVRVKFRLSYIMRSASAQRSVCGLSSAFYLLFFSILLRSHVKAVTFSLVSFSLKIVILLLVFALFYQHSQAYKPFAWCGSFFHA